MYSDSAVTSTSPSLRDTGIDAIGDTPWGTHFAIYYESPEDFLDVIVPYFATGLLADDLCLWIPSGPDAERAGRDSLRGRVRDLDARIAAGQLSVVPPDDWYGHRAPFEPNAALDRWRERYERVEDGQFPGIRACGDLGWIDNADHAAARYYETELHKFVRGRRIIALCTHPLRSTRATQLIENARAHDFVLARRAGQWESIETPKHAQAVREIERLNRELEQRVRDRTAELHRSESYLLEGQRLTHSGSFAWDVATREYTFWSAEQFRIFGFEPAATPPAFEAVIARVHRDDRDAFLNVKQVVTREKRAAELRFRLVLPDGQRRYIYKVERPVLDGNGSVIELVGSDVDITEARRAAARVARAKRRAREEALEVRFAAMLEERTRLAREIHDTLLQGVTGIALYLRALLPHLRSSPAEVADSIRRVLELAEHTARDARETLWDMRPLALVHSDFATALEELVRRTAPGVPVHLRVSGDRRTLPITVQETMLRVAQESAANTFKHAGAQRIDVELTYGGDATALTIQDDGKGFDVDAAFHAYAGRWGLLGMRERADQIGASLDVTAGRDGGTIVRLVAPLRPDSSSGKASIRA